jgi:hypothetical protein
MTTNTNHIDALTHDPIEDLQCYIDEVFSGAPPESKRAFEGWVWGLLSNTRYAHLVSRSGTIHLVSCASDSGRTGALCGFSQYADDGPFEALRECVFCREKAIEAGQIKRTP